MCHHTTAARALHPSLTLEIAEAHLGKDHLDLVVGARYLEVGWGLTSLEQQADEHHHDHGPITARQGQGIEALMDSCQDAAFKRYLSL